MRKQTPDLELDQQLRRIALGLVADPPPAPVRLPATPVASSSALAQPRRLSRYFPAFAAVTVLLTVVASVVLANSWFGLTGVDQASITPASPTATGPEPEPELVGTDWVLVEFTRDGHTTTVPADVDSDLIFDGKGRFSAKACNWGGGEAVLDGQVLHVQGGIETEVSCSGMEAAIQDAVFGDRRVPRLGVMGSGQVEWSIEQQRLVLRAANGDTLVYQVRDPIYPTRSATTITAGEHAGVQYRVALGTFEDGRDRLVLEVRRPGARWGVDGMAAPAGGGPMDSFLFSLLGDEDLVAGIVPSSAVRVVYRDPAPTGGTDLEIYRVEGADWKVFAGFVPHTGRTITAPDTITAYDADGQVVATCPSSPGAPVPRCSV